MKPKTILLTGASGNLGGSILRRLPSSYNIYSVSRRNITCKNHKHKHISSDLLKYDKLLSDLSAIHSISAIIHVAGLTGTNSPKEFQKNVSMTQNIIALAKQKKVKQIIFISSNSVNYSDRPYARSKKEAELLVRESGIPFTIIRPTLLLNKESPEFQLLSNLVKKLPLIPLLDKGQQSIQPILTTDVAAFTTLCLFNQSAYNQIYSIGGKDIITTKDLLDLFQSLNHTNKPYFNIPLPLFKSVVSILSFLRLDSIKSNLLTFSSHITVNNTKAMQSLGWQPHSLIESLFSLSF